MKIEFPALESEPLIYFLLHSGVFVFALASMFFLLGLCMGGTIWGRYKKQLQHMKLENAGQLQEIAVLKRKLAEQTMRPSTAPLTPMPTLLTEVLPSVREIFPERTLPPAAPKPLPEAQVSPPAAAAAAPASLEIADLPVLPSLAPFPEVSDASTPPPVEKPRTTTIRRPTIRVKTTKTSPAEAPKTEPPSDQSSGASLSSGDDEVAPFGFLLGEAPEPLLPPSTVSALAAIIKAPPPPLLAPESAPSDITSPPAPTPGSPIPAVLPELDPALGLIFKIAPSDADDLTRIKGIASALENRLHELGIYTWRQIAAWEERHIREFSNRLAFKDRIVREKWVEQARQLNEEQQPV